MPGRLARQVGLTVVRDTKHTQQARVLPRATHPPTGGKPIENWERRGFAVLLRSPPPPDPLRLQAG
jgi:hypothetical protein